MWQSPLALVRQRGLRPLSSNPRSRLFLPEDADRDLRNSLDRLWADYGFRIFLRDLLRNPDRAALEELTRYASPAAVLKFLESLIGMGLVEEISAGTYRCRAGDGNSFGASLERYVSRVLRREFSIPARYAVKIKGAGPGDYDVLGALGSCLLYIEVKGSPPKHIEQREIMAFWERLCSLQPDVAVYLVDTHLRMKDKLVPMFSEAMSRFKLRGTAERFPRRLENEIFRIGENLFITNTYRSLTENLRKILICLTPRRFEERPGFE